MARIYVRGPLKQLAGGRSEHVLCAATIGEAIAEFETQHPALTGWILDERGALRRHINVYVNGERGNELTPLGEDDRLDVLPAISGGAQ